MIQVLYLELFKYHSEKKDAIGAKNTTKKINNLKIKSNLSIR